MELALTWMVVTFFRTTFLWIALAVLAGTALDANPALTGLAGRRADSVEKKEVKKKLWARPESSRLMEKTFPIKEWNKHFSSLGSKRAPITMGEKDKKERYEVKILDRKTLSFEMSEWNERMSDLYKRAGIQVDTKARKFADHRLYNMMLLDAPHYQEMAEELSLRDLNRFQFRRNRSDDGVPVKKAGSGEK